MAVASVYENVKDVKRLDGKNRYETNDKTLAESGYHNVGVADGRNYPDALSASGLLKDKNLGLKLVNGSKAYKTDKVVYTFGGINSVKQDGGKCLVGHSRYNTSEVINNELGKVDTVAITTGENYADALSSINVVNSRSKVSVMLTNKISSNQESYIKDISNKIIIGGMLPKETIDKIYGRVSEKPKDDTGTTPSDDENRSYEYVYFDVALEEYQQQLDIHRPKTLDLESIKSGVPAGYKLVSTDDENRNFKNVLPNKMMTNYVYVAKEDRKVVNTQDEYNKYMISKLKTGIDDNGETIQVAKDVQPSEAVKRVADGMGFELNQSINRLENSPEKYKSITINMLIRQRFFTGEEYKKEEYNNNLKKIENLMDDSGINNINLKSEKAIRFAKYLNAKFPYNKDLSNELKNRSPYSITNYGTTVCEGFTFTYNQAMLLLDIPAISISGNSFGGPHTEAMIYDYTEWIVYNVTGLSNWSEDLKIEDINNSLLKRTILKPEDYPNEQLRNKLVSLYK